MRVLVTGGAGYVGSVVSDELLKSGHEVTVLDNLQQGHERAVLRGARFVKGDVCKPAPLARLFRESRFDAVMHMAAETVVEYSITDPRRYFQTNVTGGVYLLDAMLKHGVDRLVFSSTAAVYGEPQSIPIREDHPKRPINAYGLSKLMFEQILDWYGKAYGLKHVSFRYFNAAGATERLGEDHRPETHLIPNVLKAALDRGPVSVFGNDYPTPDGSCIRDYVHVADIARAHVLALEKIDLSSGSVYNLGNQQGYSVKEVVRTAEEVTGINIVVEDRPRRAGDPAVLIAGSSLAQSQLGWRPRCQSLKSVISSAWDWSRAHPWGYSQNE